MTTLLKVSGLLLRERIQYMVKGTRVRFCPTHAQGDTDHRDCRDGAISTAKLATATAFVKYDTREQAMTTGDEDCTAQATSYNDLFVIKEEKQ